MSLRRFEEAYARWLNAGTTLGLGALATLFIVYVLELLEPHVPLQDIASLWHLPVKEYVAATKSPTGWDWLDLLHKGDYATFVGVGLLVVITMLCYARIVPTLLRSGERLHAALAVAQILVLLAAASGVIAGAH